MPEVIVTLYACCGHCHGPGHQVPHIGACPVKECETGHQVIRDA